MKRKQVTWLEIKKAIENAGVLDTDQILEFRADRRYQTATIIVSRPNSYHCEIAINMQRFVPEGTD